MGLSKVLAGGDFERRSLLGARRSSETSTERGSAERIAELLQDSSKSPFLLFVGAKGDFVV